MTIDQRNSTNTPDLIPTLKKLTIQTTTAPLRPFQRTAGDEAQALYDNPHNLLTTALTLSRQGTWHIGIGAGTINQPLPNNTREGNGQAYKNARTAINRAKKSPGNIAYQGTTPYTNLIEATLQLIMELEEDRNNTWQQIGTLYQQGHTQQDIAQQLGTYQSAVSRSLKQGKWQETRRIIKELTTLLVEENQ